MNAMMDKNMGLQTSSSSSSMHAIPKSTSNQGRLLSMHSMAEFVVLLDTEITDWQNWTRNTGKYEGWRLQTHPLLQRKIYGVCQIMREHNDNWLYSPVFEMNEASSLIIEVTFTIRSCREHPNPEVLKNCQENLELFITQKARSVLQMVNDKDRHKFHTKVATLKSNGNNSSERIGKLSPTNWNRVDEFYPTVEETSQELVTVHVSRIKVRSSSATLAIRDSGSCSTIRRVRIGYIVCPMFRKNFIEYPRTVTGHALDGIPVSGHCVKGAALKVNKQIPQLICQTDGVWHYKRDLDLDEYSTVLPNVFSQSNGPCACAPGFGISENHLQIGQLCQQCGLNQYKTTYGPFPCQPCPKHSHNPFRSWPDSTTPSWTSFEMTFRPRNLEYQQNQTTSDTGFIGISECICDSGYFRHPLLDAVDSPCTKLPSAPRNLTINASDPARIRLNWKEPYESGGRSHVWYTLKCIQIPEAPCSSHLTTVPSIPTLITSLLIIGLSMSKSYILTVTATNELSERFSEDELIKSAAKIALTLPDPVNISINRIRFFEVDNQNNDISSTQTMTNDQIRKSTRSDELRKILKIQWDKPVISQPQNSYSRPLVETTERSHSSQWTVGNTKRYFMNGTQNQVINRHATLIEEYQIFVWLNCTPQKPTYECWNKKPALTHFLSENSVYLTDLPQPGSLAVWVRPRTVAGWGKFTQSVFNHADQNPTLTDSQAESPLTQNLALKSSESQNHSTGSDDKKPIPNRYRILIGLLVVVLILSACLIVGVASLKYCPTRNRNRSENHTDENHQTKESLEQIDNEIDKSLAFDLQMKGEQSPSLSDRSVTGPKEEYDPLKSTSKLSETKKELDPRRIQINKTIGEGEFGNVCSGNYNFENDKPPLLVAVKMLRSDVSEKTCQDFLLEATTMSQLEHPNIIKLIGIVTYSEPKMIVTEFMENGSLDKYLKDLAARNILLDRSMTCKVSDFGLTRKINSEMADDAYTFTGGKLPVRWTAPEAIIYRKFTTASDIWSFGVVAWEIFNYGERPYWNWTNQAVLTMLERGYRLPAPKNCPENIYQIILACWNSTTESRPTFQEICKNIDSLINIHQHDGNVMEIYQLPENLPTHLETAKITNVNSKFRLPRSGYSTFQNQHTSRNKLIPIDDNEDEDINDNGDEEEGTNVDHDNRTYTMMVNHHNSKTNYTSDFSTTLTNLNSLDSLKNECKQNLDLNGHILSNPMSKFNLKNHEKFSYIKYQNLPTDTYPNERYTSLPRHKLVLDSHSNESTNMSTSLNKTLLIYKKI